LAENVFRPALVGGTPSDVVTGAPTIATAAAGANACTGAFVVADALAVAVLVLVVLVGVAAAAAPGARATPGALWSVRTAKTGDEGAEGRAVALAGNIDRVKAAGFTEAVLLRP
jgi:hypothetical protein